MNRVTRACILVVLLTLPTAAFAAGGGTVLAPSCNSAKYKPKRIVISCGDGNIYVKSLRWSSWTGKRATGKGVNEINDCTPSCVAGKFRAYAAAVILSKPKRCSKVKRHKVFGEIKLVYTSKSPGKSRTYTSSLACPTG